MSANIPVQEQLANLAARKNAGEISEAQFDQEVTRVLALDRLPAAVGSVGASPARDARATPRAGRSRGSIVMGVLGVITVLVTAGLAATVADDRSVRSQLSDANKSGSQLAAQVSQLQGQNSSVQQANNQLQQQNNQLKASPTFLLANLSNATLPTGHYYTFSVPYGFSVTITMNSSAPIDVRFFQPNGLVQWANAGSPSGGGFGWFGQTALSGVLFDGAEGCSGYMLVVNGGSAATITLQATAAYAPASAATCK